MPSLPPGLGGSATMTGAPGRCLARASFVPWPGAQPFVGAVGEQESVAEYRVEMVLDRSVLTEVVAALKAAHPYETPAFDVMALINTD